MIYSLLHKNKWFFFNNVMLFKKTFLLLQRNKLKIFKLCQTSHQE